MSETIAEIVLSVICEEYEKNKTGLAQYELVNKIAEIRKEALKAAHKPVSKNLHTNIQTYVSKATKKYIERKQITFTADKTYIPYNKKHERTAVRKDIRENIPFCKEAYSMSNNTILLSVPIEFAAESIDKLKQYIGVENYFDVVLLSGYIAVFLQENEEESIHKLCTDIKELVKESIEHQKKMVPKVKLKKN